MYITRKTVLNRLCVLSTKIGTQKLKHTVSHDCLCDNSHDFRFDDEIIKFIEDAVKEKLKKE